MYMSKFQNYNMPQYNKHGYVNPQFHNWIKPNEIRLTPSEAEKDIDIEVILELPKLYHQSEEGDGIKFEERPTKSATTQAQDLQGIFDVYKYIKKP
jgi:hypothetical protein